MRESDWHLVGFKIGSPLFFWCVGRDLSLYSLGFITAYTSLLTLTNYKEKIHPQYQSESCVASGKRQMGNKADLSPNEKGSICKQSTQKERISIALKTADRKLIGPPTELSSVYGINQNVTQSIILMQVDTTEFNVLFKLNRDSYDQCPWGKMIP